MYLPKCKYVPSLVSLQFKKKEVEYTKSKASER